jgi:NTP pyrophosphatase (non-canonical NTP hydrolase)
MKYTLNEYQADTLRTAQTPEDKNLALAILGLGCAGEAGEVADYLKKVVGHGHELNVETVKKELGDVMWYVSVLADEVGLTLEDIAQANIDKLRKRYPDGFSSERSINRKEDEE